MIGFQGKFLQEPVPSDFQCTTLMAGGTGQAFNWPTDAQIVRLSGCTTAGAPFGFGVNLRSTGAHLAAAASTLTTLSSGTLLVPPGDSRVFQVPGGSTGFSIMGGAAGLVSIELWKKGG